MVLKQEMIKEQGAKTTEPNNILKNTYISDTFFQIKISFFKLIYKVKRV